MNFMIEKALISITYICTSVDLGQNRNSVVCRNLSPIFIFFWSFSILDKKIIQDRKLYLQPSFYKYINLFKGTLSWDRFDLGAAMVNISRPNWNSRQFVYFLDASLKVNSKTQNVCECTKHTRSTKLIRVLFVYFSTLSIGRLKCFVDQDLLMICRTPALAVCCFIVVTYRWHYSKNKQINRNK